MGVVVRRYLDFHIILLIPTPLVLALFLQQHPYLFVHFKNVFCFCSILHETGERNRGFALLMVAG